MNFWMLDIGYRIKSDIRYNVGLCSLQSDIKSSDIKLSPISLITDIGVSAHLCQEVTVSTALKTAMLNLAKNCSICWQCGTSKAEGQRLLLVRFQELGRYNAAISGPVI